jgi:hypothetical protein
VVVRVILGRSRRMIARPVARSVAVRGSGMHGPHVHRLATQVLQLAVRTAVVARVAELNLRIRVRRVTMARVSVQECAKHLKLATVSPVRRQYRVRVAIRSAVQV